MNYKTSMTQWRNNLDFNNQRIPLENASHSYEYATPLHEQTEDDIPYSVEYMYRENNEITSYYKDRSYRIAVFEDAWTAQKYLDTYFYDNYKEVATIPCDEITYFLIRGEIESIEIANNELMIIFYSGDFLNLQYQSAQFANYQYQYLYAIIEERNLDFTTSDWVHIWSGHSIKTTLQNNIGKKIYVHAGNYSEGFIPLNNNTYFLYCDKNAYINCSFRYSGLVSNLKVYGYGVFTWNDEQGFLQTITGGFGNFFCKSITITHGIHNIPVIFVNPGGDHNESYFIMKGQTVVTDNEQYTFLDFDATEPDFTVDIDFARITLTSAGLEYGFFQSIIETTKACVIWRNALVRNEGVVANVFDYSSSFALSEHICVNLKVYNSVDDGNGYNYSSEAPNLYNLYIHSCWYEVPNVVFYTDFPPMPNKIKFFGDNYSKLEIQENNAFNLTNPQNITINPALNLLS